MLGGLARGLGSFAGGLAKTAVKSPKMTGMAATSITGAAMGAYRADPLMGESRLKSAVIGAGVGAGVGLAGGLAGRAAVGAIGKGVRGGIGAARGRIGGLRSRMGRGSWSPNNSTALFGASQRSNRPMNSIRDAVRSSAMNTRIGLGMIGENIRGSRAYGATARGVTDILQSARGPRPSPYLR